MGLIFYCGAGAVRNLPENPPARRGGQGVILGPARGVIFGRRIKKYSNNIFLDLGVWQASDVPQF